MIYDPDEWGGDVVVRLARPTLDALTDKACALNMTPAGLVARLVASEVCHPEDKGEQIDACGALNDGGGGQ